MKRATHAPMLSLFFLFSRTPTRFMYKVNLDKTRHLHFLNSDHNLTGAFKCGSTTTKLRRGSSIKRTFEDLSVHQWERCSSSNTDGRHY